MSFSSGTFSINSAGQPVVTGTVISSTAFNALTADLATGLSTCMLKDGTQTLTANIPMSSFKLTGLAAGSANGDSVRYQQVLLLAGGTMTGNLLFTDATYDIGASGATRPRDLFLSRNAVIGGDITMSAGSIIQVEGAAVASAATTDIWAVSDGDTVHITGTTTITSFGTAPQAGARKHVIFDGVLTLTHGANLSLPGSANITTAADDFAFVYADTTTQMDVLYFKKNGTAVVATSVSAASQAEQETGSSTTVYVSPGRQQFHPSAVKAAVRFNAAGTIAHNYNISSVTDSGVGNWIVNIDTDFSGAGLYAGVGMCGRNSSFGALVLDVDATSAAGAFALDSRDTADGIRDPDAPDEIHVIFVGDQ